MKRNTLTGIVLVWASLTSLEACESDAETVGGTDDLTVCTDHEWTAASSILCGSAASFGYVNEAECLDRAESAVDVCEGCVSQTLIDHCLKSFEDERLGIENCSFSGPSQCFGFILGVDGVDQP